MKLTKSQLKQIIKEEIEIALNEMEVSGGNLPADHPARQALKLTKDVDVLLDDINKTYEESLQGEDTDAIAVLLLETIKRMLTTPSNKDDPKSPLVYKDRVPPPLAELAELTMAKDYAAIRSNFNRLWTQVLQWHRDTGISFPPRVSHNFRTIDTIVRNLW
tara:strand:+ start:251 stop:733 length:483 start_codon:yes stop_codon:yes gene_type:complete